MKPALTKQIKGCNGDAPISKIFPLSIEVTISLIEIETILTRTDTRVHLIGFSSFSYTEIN